MERVPTTAVGESSSGTINSQPRPRRFVLLSDEDLESLADPEWLVDAMLPAGSLAILYGQPGAGKTFLALDLAYSVATAKPWCGAETTPGAVVYVIAEGVTGLRQRTRAWKRANEARDVRRVRFVREAVQLSNKGEVELFLHDLKEQIQEPVSLIVFDTLARCFVGSDENSAKDTGLLIDGAERVRRETGAAILLVHHATKQGSEERGSSALRGAVDTMLSLAEGLGVVTLGCEKQKDGAPFRKIRLRLVPVSGSCVVEMAGDAQPHETVLQCLRTLAELNGGGGSSCGEWMVASGLTQTTFYRCRGELQRTGMIGRQGRKYCVTDAGRAALGLIATPEVRSAS